MDCRRKCGLECGDHLIDEDEEMYEACMHDCLTTCKTIQSLERGVNEVRVVALCRDHNDNILFEAVVESLEDEKRVWRECRRYRDNTWVDYIIIQAGKDGRVVHGG